jgi:hypothetical protein
MTEYQIELTVEKRIDALDARYMAGELTERAYKTAIAAVDEWANAQYRTMSAETVAA